MSSPSLPILRYFMFPGRCYAARVAMFNAFGKEGWVDERLSQSKFRKMKLHAAEARSAKQEPVLANNNLPQLLLPAEAGAGTLTITQSHAIARWAARQPGGEYVLYPETTSSALVDALLVDEAMALVDGVIGLAPKDADKATRLEKRSAYASAEEETAGPLFLALRQLENRLQTSGGPFLLGEDLNIADLYVKKPLVDMILDKQFEGVAPDYVAQHFPLLARHTEDVQSHPLLQEYLKHYKS